MVSPLTDLSFMTRYFFPALAGSFDAAEPDFVGAVVLRSARRPAFSDERTIT